MKTIEQERAYFALKCIERIKSIRDAKKKDKYKTNSKRLPALIITNGLGPTLAFLKSKKETKAIYDDLEEWLKQRGRIRSDALKEILEEKSLQEYRIITAEALAFANWLKRMAEIELKE
ncbi:type III-B CRISPR module-associated protein Cmr5 [SCandidatus Aminicenantes bacterium Aminicenantia_JdfR_composite]|jgi:CRISPR-associated protein Cmr5|nr:type III-B CRISPR module-associated protein Cmr5 [SCandidatus Aminicenantes bacterium Aminicenantia_JdfR_composite]MCP2596988.1 type III-B CRISPR module-associated protein Cmr5 [Candidatus Aminicenantes bacterium AC-335-G13]MCP2598692.1 type III-B CRISPR module-associated protein Cmr5 [Candidatus Aminicenantes bacterium AC-335-L06]MCP2620620.1 type III-B CRISPR module-associated protein Cmr5 [Candidatus Aminicenantes bacterium AC-334-E05]